MPTNFMCFAIMILLSVLAIKPKLVIVCRDWNYLVGGLVSYYEYFAAMLST